MQEKLLEYMNGNNINQGEFASLLNISQSHLSKVLNGKKKAGAQLVEKYYNLPGVQEKEKLNRARRIIEKLWTTEEISNEIAKKLLKALDNPGD